MDPKFQTSFIPKKTVATSTSPLSMLSPQTESDFLTMLSKALFVVALLVSGFLFGYKLVLERQIENANKELVAAQGAFDPQAIQALITANARMFATKALLNNHIIVTQVFDLLQFLTVKNVQLSDFSYSNNNNIIKVTANVEAKSYGSLFQQSVIFSQNAFMIDPTFADFDISEDGHITAKFTTNLDPGLVSYKKVVEAMNAGISPNSAVTSTLASTTTIIGTSTSAVKKP